MADTTASTAPPPATRANGVTAPVLKALGTAAGWLPVAIPYVWMLAFFLIPFLIVVRISVSTSELAMPPYSPTFESLGQAWEKAGEFTLENYQRITEDSLYVSAYFSSVWIALVSTVLTLLIGYPIAYGMARAPARWRPTLLMLVILPFWTSFLIRIYAWMGILSQEGFLNQFLGLFGIEPLTILQTNTAVYIGIVYSYLPFMILPLYSALEKMDDTLLEAAADLGCTPLGAFWKVTWPLSMPGIIAGCFLVFIPVVGEFVIPDLLGGSETLMIGRTLWEEFYANRDWPAASAIAVILLLILVVPIMIFQNQQGKGVSAHR